MGEVLDMTYCPSKGKQLHNRTGHLRARSVLEFFCSGGMHTYIHAAAAARSPMHVISVLKLYSLLLVARHYSTAALGVFSVHAYANHEPTVGFFF